MLYISQVLCDLTFIPEQGEPANHINSAAISQYYYNRKLYSVGINGDGHGCKLKIATPGQKCSICFSRPL
jgi:hypothetical protein